MPTPYDWNVYQSANWYTQSGNHQQYELYVIFVSVQLNIKETLFMGILYRVNALLFTFFISFSCNVHLILAFIKTFTIHLSLLSL